MSAQNKWNIVGKPKKPMIMIKIYSLVPPRTVLCMAGPDWHQMTVSKVYLIEGQVKTLAAICPVHNEPIFVE